MPKALVTGGTGFVGGHAALALLNDGWSVRVLARDPSRSSGGLLEGCGAEMHRGDLASDETLEEATRGVDAIVHAAGLLKARSLEDYREVNLRGTERLLRAAARGSPRARFVYVSSQAAAGPARDGRPVTESDPPVPVSWYGVSKREGEEAVARWPGEWTVLRPAVVYGPGDRGLLAYFRMAASGFVPVPAGDTRVQLIGVDRAALAISRAAVPGAALARRTGFLCDPAPLTVRELAQRIAAASGQRARLLSVPDGVVRLLGAAETVVERITRRSRPFNADKAREILAGDWLCDGRPVEEALRLPAPRPLDEALRALWAWYRRAGWVPNGRPGGDGMRAL